MIINTLSPIIEELREDTITKILLRLLRQGAVKENIPVQPDGFAPLSAIVNHRSIHKSDYTLEEIIQIIESDQRKFFTLRNLKNDLEIPPSIVRVEYIRVNIDDWVIKANLSDLSKPIDDTVLQFKPLNSYLDFHSSTMIHATCYENLPIIFDSGGISRKNGDYIYLARAPCSLSEYKEIFKMKYFNTFIYINVGKVLHKGVKLFLLKGNTIITKGDENGFLQIELIDKIVDKNGFPLKIRL